MDRSPFTRLAAGYLIALALLVSGCAEDVVAPPPAGAAFTLWGALNPTASRQAIRVVPVDPTVDGPASGPIDAVVTSVNERTGERTTWTDSLITFSDGSRGHVFVAPVGVSYNGRYRLEVMRSDGTVTRALVDVPPLVEPFLEADEGGSPDEAALWMGAPQLNAVTIRLTVRDSRCETVVHDVPMSSIAGALAEPFEFGWRTGFSLTHLREGLTGTLRESVLLRVAFLAEVASAEWRFPTEVFDPEILIEPGAFTNVENGFGFVGAAYPVMLAYTPDPRAATRAGFRGEGEPCSP